jgi:hypothetical protein
MRLLKQSTSVDVPIGPFLDDTDGKTAETALTLTQPDIRLKKNGAAWAQKAAAQTLTHEENGYYEVTLDATDTNTLGLLRLHVIETGALPVWEDFMVMPANVWDSLFGADLLQVDVTQLGGDAQSSTDLKDFADAGYDPATNKVQGVVLADTVTTYTGNTPQTGDAFARLGAPTGASVSVDVAAVKAQTAAIEADTQDIQARIPAALVGGRIDANVGAISADATAADNAEAFFDGTGYAGTGNTIPTVTTLTNAPSDSAGVTTLVSRIGVPTNLGGGGTIAANLVDIEAQTDDIGAAGAGLTALATQASVNTLAGYVDTEVAAIKAKTDQLTFTNPNQVDSFVALMGAGVVDDTAFAAEASIADAVHDEVVEGSYTLRQLVRLMAAALLGKAAGMATTTGTFRDLGDTKNRITATITADGDRTAVTLDGS